MPKCNKCNDTGVHRHDGDSFQCIYCPEGVARIEALLPSRRLPVARIESSREYEDVFAVFDAI